MARRHDEILALGARLVAIDVDSPPQHSAMIDKLRLPFPMLSDEDRSAVIEPWGLANPTDRRNLAIPAIVVVTPDGDEAYRWVGRDFAFRLPEDDLLGVLQGLGLEPTQQEPPALGRIEPGPTAMPVRAMAPYFRGARFASVALGIRHPGIRDDVDFFVEQMDRFSESVRELKARLQGEAEEGA